RRRLDRQRELARDARVVAAERAPDLDHVAWRAVLDERAVVRVERAACGHARERRARGHVERRNLFWPLEPGAAQVTAEPRRAQPIEWERTAGCSSTLSVMPAPVASAAAAVTPEP